MSHTMRLLTPRPIVDQLVFRYNIGDHDYFPDCFRIMEKHWEDIPFRNQDPVWFKLSNRYPSNDHIWHLRPYRLENNFRVYDDVLDLEKLPDRPTNKSKPHALVGTLSKYGKRYRKNYLLVVPGLGRLYIHRQTLKFFVETAVLLRAQVHPGGLHRLMWRIYKRLWRVLGLWFFISDFDLAVDVDADPKLLADLRLAETRQHFVLSGPLVRHKSHTFRETRVEDQNGITFGTRNSRFAALLYDRNECIRNAGSVDRQRLRRNRKIMEDQFYSHHSQHHTVRLEARFSDLLVWPAGGSSSRPTIRRARDFPTKHDWLHNPAFHRVYWDQLDLVGLFGDFVGGLEILRSDLQPFQIYQTRRAVLSESVGHFRAANLRRVRKQEPDRWNRMRHPYHRLLASAVATMGKSALEETDRS